MRQPESMIDAFEQLNAAARQFGRDVWAPVERQLSRLLNRLQR